MKKMLAVLLCLCCLAGGAMAEETEQPDVIELMTQYTGLDLTPYEGKTILLNYFTEWCPYCMQEMPELREVAQLYDEAAFQMIFIHPWDGEDASNTRSVQQKYGLEDMVFYEDEDFAACSLVGLRGYPATLIVDENGAPAFGANYKVTLEMITQVLDGLGVPRKVDAQ